MAAISLASSTSVSIDHFVMIDFLTESLFMIPLLCCSLVAVAVIVHRLVSLREGQVLPDALQRALSQGDREGIRTSLQTADSSLARVCQRALGTVAPDRMTAVSRAETAAREEVTKLQAGLSTLEVIITIAPLLGLLGTVSGLVTVFSGLGSADASQLSGTGMARGIAEALNTTIAGLVVAVPAVIAHGYFQRKIDRITARMETILQDAIDRFHVSR